jgi:hypothetical protein
LEGGIAEIISFENIGDGFQNASLIGSPGAAST